MNYIQEAVLIVLGCVILGLGIVGYVEHNTIVNLRGELQTALTEKSVCETANNSYKVLAASQSSDIRKLVAAGKLRETNAAKAVAAAQLLRDRAATKAAAIMAQPVNQNDCQGAMEVLQSYIGRTP